MVCFSDNIGQKETSLHVHASRAYVSRFLQIVVFGFGLAQRFLLRFLFVSEILNLKPFSYVSLEMTWTISVNCACTRAFSRESEKNGDVSWRSTKRENGDTRYTRASL